MQNHSNVEMLQTEILSHLQCDPRVFKLKLKKKYTELLESEIQICIKCTDQHILDIFNDWFGNESKGATKRVLKENKNNKLAFFLKFIAEEATLFCIQNKEYIIDLDDLNKSLKNNDSLKTIQECFEVTNINYDVYLSTEHFKIIGEDN